MPSKRENRNARREQAERDTQTRRDTEVRGSMGVPPGNDAGQPDRERMRGSTSESVNRARREGRIPLPD